MDYTVYNPHTAEDYIKSYIRNSGFSPEDWYTDSAGVELLGYMEAHDVETFEEVPEHVITDLLTMWDRQYADSNHLVQEF